MGLIHDKLHLLAQFVLPGLIEGFLGCVGKVKSHFDLLAEPGGKQIFEVCLQFRDLALCQEGILQKNGHDIPVKTPVTTGDHTVFNLPHLLTVIQYGIPVLSGDLLKGIGPGKDISVLYGHVDIVFIKQFCLDVGGDLSQHFSGENMLTEKMDDQLFAFLL